LERLKQRRANWVYRLGEYRTKLEECTYEPHTEYYEASIKRLSEGIEDLDKQISELENCEAKL
jgi:prefoldin subunit 5